METTVNTTKANKMEKYFTPFRIITFIIFVLSVVLLFKNVYTTLNTIAAFSAGLLSFLSWMKSKKNVSDLLVSTLIVGDCVYFASLFFMIARTFMGM